LFKKPSFDLLFERHKTYHHARVLSIVFYIAWHEKVMLKKKFWRGGRVAEGAPLLREYGVYSLIEGSNPSFSAIK
jgi:hypothetical protein